MNPEDEGPRALSCLQSRRDLGVTGRPRLFLNAFGTPVAISVSWKSILLPFRRTIPEWRYIAALALLTAERGPIFAMIPATPTRSGIHPLNNKTLAIIT